MHLDLDAESARIAAEFFQPGPVCDGLAAKISLFVRFVAKRTSTAQELADLGTGWSIACKDEEIHRLSDAGELKDSDAASLALKTEVDTTYALKLSDATAAALRIETAEDTKTALGISDAKIDEIGRAIDGLIVEAERLGLSSKGCKVCGSFTGHRGKCSFGAALDQARSARDAVTDITGD